MAYVEFRLGSKVNFATLTFLICCPGKFSLLPRLFWLPSLDFS